MCSLLNIIIVEEGHSHGKLPMTCYCAFVSISLSCYCVSINFRHLKALSMQLHVSEKQQIHEGVKV